jgi:hypothetical protein
LKGNNPTRLLKFICNAGIALSVFKIFLNIFAKGRAELREQRKRAHKEMFQRESEVSVVPLQHPPIVRIQTDKDLSTGFIHDGNLYMTQHGLDDCKTMQVDFVGYRDKVYPFDDKTTFDFGNRIECKDTDLVIIPIAHDLKVGNENIPIKKKYNVAKNVSQFATIIAFDSINDPRKIRAASGRCHEQDGELWHFASTYDGDSGAVVLNPTCAILGMHYKGTSQGNVATLAKNLFLDSRRD